MRVLVTGGLGFCGSFLVRELLGQGHFVTIMDNLGRDRALAERNWSEFHGEAAVRAGDIRDYALVESAVEGQDAIFHLAAVVNARLSVERPKETFDINAGGTQNLLEAARKHDVKRFIFASTLAVYGKPEYLPYDENHPTNPSSPYGVSKLCGEHLVRNYGELYGIKTTSLRFSNIYGKGGAGVVSVFLDRIAGGSP